MNKFTRIDIDKMAKIFRLNLIKSITGYISANLIGTKTNDKINNVALFSSVTHLGSDPPLIGFITRPENGNRNTYNNILKNKFFTINHIVKNQIISAHQSSAKYPKNVSEFDKTDLKVEFKNNFDAPFVKDSPVQIGCSFVNKYFIKENKTTLMIGQVEMLFINKKLLVEDGFVQLDREDVITVNGLDGYALPKLIKRIPYARP